MGLTGEDTVQRNFAYEWVTGRVAGILIPVASVLLAIVIGALIILVSGGNPLSAYWQLLQGAFGSLSDTSETLVAAIPLILAGLAVAFAFRAGLFNIGGQGQLIIGGVVSAWIGYHLNLPGVILIPIALLAGALGGAVWASIAGVLKAWRGAHEVITTIMLNYIALAIVQYLIQSTPTGQPGPMAQSTQTGNPETPPMNASLPNIVPGWIMPPGPSSRLHLGLLVALAMVVLFWFLLWRTTLGYKIRAVGFNPKAAAYGGINVGWNIVLAMLIAGAFAGLAGMVTIYGLAPYQLDQSFWQTSAGFDAIAVALLGRNTAIGVLAAGILFGALDHASGAMQSQAHVSGRLVEILQGLIIFFIGAEAIVRYLARIGRARLPRMQKREATA